MHFRPILLIAGLWFVLTTRNVKMTLLRGDDLFDLGGSAASLQ